MATDRVKGKLSWGVAFARARKLAIPYLIWSFVALSLAVIFGRRPSVTDIVLDLLTGQTNEVFYFVPLLIQFYILAPIFVMMIKKNWLLVLIVTGIIQVCVQLLPYPIFLGFNMPYKEEIASFIPKWLFVARIFWFPLGITIGFHIDQFKQYLVRYRWGFFFGAIACIVIGIVEWEIFFRLSGMEWLSTRETLVDSIYALMFIFLILGMGDFGLPLQRFFEKLAPKSFGIYLTHALVITYVAKVIYRFTPALLGTQILYQPIMIILGLGLPLLLMAFVDRSPFRKFYVYLFG